MSPELQDRQAISESWGRSCNGKNRYRNEQAAIFRAARLQREIRELIGVYHCPHCKSYHIGHVPYWIKEEINAV